MTTTRQCSRGALTFLTTAFVLLAACLLGAPAASAQWTTPDASGNITNTNTGNVGIGVPTPTFRFEVRGTSSRNTATFMGDGDSVGYAGIRFQPFTLSNVASNRTSIFNFHMRKDTWYGGDGSGPSFVIETVSNAGGFAAPFLITPTNDIILNGGKGASNMAVGGVGVGTTAPQATFHVSTSSIATGSRGIIDEQTSNDANGALLIVRKSRAGAAAQNGDSIGNLYASAFDGTSWVSGSRIRFAVDGPVSAGVVPTAMQFITGVDNSTVERMRIDSAGRVGIGTTAPAYNLQVGPLWNNLGSNYALAVGGDAFIGNMAPGGVAKLGFAEGTSGWQSGLVKRNGYFEMFDNQGKIYLNGSVGVGTSAPGAAYKLDVAGSVNSAGLCIAGDCKTAWSQVGGGTSSQWTTSGTSISYSAGNVGVGTSSPDKIFTVQGQVPSIAGTMAVVRTTGTYHGNGLALDAAGTGNNNLGFLVNGTRRAVISWDNSRNFLGLINSAYSENDFALRLNSDGSLTYHDVVNASAERLRLTAAGSLGIGTSAPERRLHVLGGSIESQWSTTAGQGYGFFISRDNNHIAENAYYNGVEWRAIKAGKAAVFQTYTAGDYAFYVQSDNTSRAAEAPRSFSPIFVIKTDGRVGMGTTTPGAAYKLDVAGSVNSAGLCIAGDCKTAWSQVGGGTSSQWTTSGANVYYNAGNVGIGTTNPLAKLSVMGGADTSLIVGDRGLSGSVGMQFLGSGYRHAGLRFDGDNVVVENASNSLTPSTWHLNGQPLNLVVRNGSVGVGTTNPAQLLDVVGTWDTKMRAVGPAGAALQLQETSGVATWSEWQQVNDRLRLNSNDGTTTRPDLMTILPTGNVGIGTANPTARLDVVGDIKATGSVSATYQDVAEWVPSRQKLAAGTVVVLDTDGVNHVVASATAYDTKVAGVISGTPGVILGVEGEGKLKVATTGRVKVKADATRAPIRVGDLLVTSGVEGMAMKSVPVDLGGTPIHRPGTIIGKALEPLASGTGEILVLLSLQ